MTEKEAWEFLSVKFKEKDFIVGICGLIYNLRLMRINNFSKEDEYKMLNKIATYGKKRKKKKYPGGYLWPLSRKGSLQRSRFCARQARLLIKERRLRRYATK